MQTLVNTTLARALLLGALAAASGCAPEAPNYGEEPLGEADSAIYRTGTPWPADANGDVNIPVCWHSSASTHPRFAAQSAEIRHALSTSWERFTRIRFTGWGNCGASTRRVIQLKDGAGGGWSNGSDAEYPVIEIDFDELRPEWVRYIATHEFGHSLGFAHEHQRPEAWVYIGGAPRYNAVCPNLDDPSDGNLAPIAGGTTYGDYDVLSVMHYFDESVEGLCGALRDKLSAGDIAAAQAIYGRSADADGIEVALGVLAPLL